MEQSEHTLLHPYRPYAFWKAEGDAQGSLVQQCRQQVSIAAYNHLQQLFSTLPELGNPLVLLEPIGLAVHE